MQIFLLLLDLALPTEPASLPLEQLWYFFPIGYLVTILIEIPVLLVGLPGKIKFTSKLACGAWLTFCTYPIVVLVLPVIFENSSRLNYLLVAETFAPAAECFLFWVVFAGKDLLNGKDWVRSFIAIILANLASFGIGEILSAFRWFGLFG